MRLGMAPQKRARFMRLMAEAAERASYWIWLKRKDTNWSSLA